MKKMCRVCTGKRLCNKKIVKVCMMGSVQFHVLLLVDLFDEGLMEEANLFEGGLKARAAIEREVSRGRTKGAG